MTGIKKGVGGTVYLQKNIIQLQVISFLIMIRKKHIKILNQEMQFKIKVIKLPGAVSKKVDNSEIALFFVNRLNVRNFLLK